MKIKPNRYSRLSRPLWYVIKPMMWYLIKQLMILYATRHPTPVLLPGKSHGLRSLVGWSPWGRWESDTTERLHFHFPLSTFMHWRRKWQPTPVFLPGESQGWGSLVGCHLWGRTGSDTNEVAQQQQQQQSFTLALFSIFYFFMLTFLFFKVMNYLDESEISRSTSINCISFDFHFLN